MAKLSQTSSSPDAVMSVTGPRSLAAGRLRLPSPSQCLSLSFLSKSPQELSPLPQPVQGIHRWRDVPNPLRPNLTLTLPNPGRSAVRKKPKASGKGRLGGPWKVMSHWEAMPPVTFHLCSNGRFLGAKRALLVSVGARGEQRGGFITSNPWWDKGLPPLT